MIKYHFFGKTSLNLDDQTSRQNFLDELSKVEIVESKIDADFSSETSTQRDFANFSDRNSATVANQQYQNHGCLNLLLLKQVHGKEVLIIDSKEKIYRNKLEADGIVSNQTGVILGIVTADCAPILFFDEDKEIIGACHAGWRGAKAGIIEKTVEAMKKLKANKVAAIIGPLIAKKSYQITGEFLENFLAESRENQIFFEKDCSPNHYLFDLRGYVESKLRKAGISSIQHLEIDTYSNPEKFASYRRSCHLDEKNGKKNYGQNISVVAIVPANNHI